MEYTKYVRQTTALVKTKTRLSAGFLMQLNAGLTCLFIDCIFVPMAYNRRNYIKRAKYIISVYNQYKHADVPDTRILNNYFPQHNIYISYRQWMNIKGMVFTSPATDQQLSLFN